MKIIAIPIVTSLIGTWVVEASADDVATKKESSIDKQLELRVEMPDHGSRLLAVKIVNHGAKTVTLVKPGDGSERGWRTPIIAWSVIAGEMKEARHPAKSPVLTSPRCKLIDPLKRSDIVDIAPGKTLRLDVAIPEFRTGGTYRVVFYYQNSPRMQWKGVPYEKHDPTALKRMRSSTPCTLKSNEITFGLKELKGIDNPLRSLKPRTGKNARD